jgi:hypothetical protein
VCECVYVFISACTCVRENLCDASMREFKYMRVRASMSVYVCMCVHVCVHVCVYVCVCVCVCVCVSVCVCVCE